MVVFSRNAPDVILSRKYSRDPALLVGARVGKVVGEKRVEEEDTAERD